MRRAYIGLGANLGDGRANLQEAWRRLGEATGVALLAISSPYLTKPLAKAEWLVTGRMVGAGMFTNAVGLVESNLLPLVLLKVMQDIENAMGRDRARSVDRPIDLDFLYYDDLVLSGHELCLPHPEIQNRRFVLSPLAELAPDYRHPLFGLTSLEMLQRLARVGDDEIVRIDWGCER
ncbi:MAG: 2-amino-4-hydroxy-6-hydroxymethyldihydropteridine diphosphokinase [Desulfobulbaceae bacterium]|nr:2-amino-4-hydroxy-6-hydroxymethyldihydropteridine diphosphokinase [Desulfobulbaceae bacterium]